MVAVTHPSAGIICSAWTVTINCTLDILYSTKIEDLVHFFVSSHMFLRFMWVRLICCGNVSWSETKFSNCLTGSCHVCQSINYVSCGEWVVVLLLYISILCVLFLFVYFVFNFLHCFTGQKLMLLGRCILSILLFIVYRVRSHNKCNIRTAICDRVIASMRLKCSQSFFSIT